MQTSCRGSQLGCIDKKIPVFECEQAGKRKGRTWNAMCVQAQPGMRWQKTSASDAGAKTAHPITMRCASWERQLAAGGDEESRTPVRKPLTKAFYECSHLIKIPSAPRQMAGSALQ